MTAFEGTSNKSIIREKWDLFIIQEWYTYITHPLTYFGLPGPYIKDILAWKTYLGECTGVERLRTKANEHAEDLNIHRQMLKNVARYNIQSFQLMRGQIEDIILDGIDSDKNSPRLSSKVHPLIANFQYDLVNLDFYGGLGYRDKNGESKRVKSIRKLIERQKGKDFLFILTLNVRDGIEDEFDRYLLGSKQGTSSTKMHDILEWYREKCGKGMKEYKLKSVVPLFIKREAEQWGFEFFTYPPISYTGDGGARMVHFVFKLKYTKSILSVFSEQLELDVLNLVSLTIKSDMLLLSEVQHPEFDYSYCEEQLNFLPLENRISLMQSIPSKKI